MDDAEGAADLLKKLSNGDEDNKLMSYQIGFDLYESATQNYLGRVLTQLKAIATPYFQTVAETKEAETTEEPQDEEMKEEPVEVKPARSDTAATSSNPPVTEEGKKHYDQLMQILSGEVRQ